MLREDNEQKSIKVSCSIRLSLPLFLLLNDLSLCQAPDRGLLCTWLTQSPQPFCKSGM